MVGRLTRRRVLFFAAAAAPMLVAAAQLAEVALASAGRHPLWQLAPLNIAEAAALNDAATVVRLIESGADVNAVYPIRRGVLRGRTMQLTPLAAAREAGETDIEALLLEAGASQ